MRHTSHIIDMILIIYLLPIPVGGRDLLVHMIFTCLRGALRRGWESQHPVDFTNISAGPQRKDNCNCYHIHIPLLFCALIRSAGENKHIDLIR
jgi:hypothetical protein